MNEELEPCYVISVAAKMLGVNARTLRYYERLGLVAPARTGGNRRLYSLRDIQRLRQVQRLTHDLGINLAGVDAVLHLRQRMVEMEQDMQRLEAEVKRLTASDENVTDLV